ncbi:chemotaxis protein CheW [Rhodomicrobium vannielii ATCC 17100]|uniref:chemotaxis protein CheW n=1 Tax=Rhodomicrobium vannielii TaxID=1069 RepID=UPI0019181463|nr:chemotaxis protein CheW [Rhodomicrobium vannielii]MBJ7535901.1 chemotaxis protein CheW [Rhodomicrobium vannielii ATCC 17100]
MRAMQPESVDTLTPRREPFSAASAHIRADFFTVFVADQVYGISVADAPTIFSLGEVTPVPSVRGGFIGLTNLRGRIVVTVNLREWLGLQPKAGRTEKYAIALDVRNECIALLVDKIGDVLTLPEMGRAEVPPHFKSRKIHFAREMYFAEIGLIPILDKTLLFNQLMAQVSEPRQAI